MFDRLTDALGLTSPHQRIRQLDYEPIVSPLTTHSRNRSLSVGPSRHGQRRSSVSVQSQDEGEAKIKRAHHVLGAASLLSWNAMITTMPYFLARLDGSSLKSPFPSYLSLTFSLLGFLGLAHAAASTKQANSSLRIRRSALILIAALFLLSMSPFIPSNATPFFLFVLVNAAVQATCGAYFQSAVVALASLFGPYAIQAVFSGQAAVGVLVCLTQFITTAATLGKKKSDSTQDQPTDDHRRQASVSAFLFFSISTAFLGFTLWMYTWLVGLPAYKAVVVPAEAAKAVGIVVEDIGDDEPLDHVPSPDEERHLLSVQIQSEVKASVSVWKVARKNWAYNFAVFYVFVITLAVFPPITASIESTHNTSGDFASLFSPIVFNVLHFLVFNIGDYIGRALCSYPHLVFSSPKKLVLASLARTSFIPFFLACNLQQPTSPQSPTGSLITEQPLINSDVIYLLGLLLFGITNGHLGTLCMICASSPEYNLRLKLEQVEIAAVVAQFCLAGGLAVGSLMSFAVRGIVCQCNPFTE
ncbi:hypothetical protein FRB99_003880 [Tulasnella sp. 403]|nr:hypothetical protein FRB99_003880 [Tulasnella sp. 403]